MRHRFAVLFVVALVSLAAKCADFSQAEISRERAIEIAQPHVSFQPDSIEAERATSAGRAVWRVTFRGRLPGQPPGLFETIVVEVDRQSGEIVSIART